MKNTYKRNGTLNLFAALESATAQIHGQTTELKRRKDFRHFLDGVVAELTAHKEIQVILDHHRTHQRNDDWLAKYEGRIQFHLTRQVLRGVSLCSKDQLRSAIEVFVARTNEHLKPCRWRKREVRGSQLRNIIVNLCK